MNVTDAVNARKSVRAFLADAVDDDTIADLLRTASRAPSGGNVQPWRIYVINGDSMTRFRQFLADRPVEAPAYDIYPSPLVEPYRTSRFKIGEDMYATLGIGRDDKAGRLAQFAKNLDFFGAPAAIFCFVDRIMGPPQWSDLGMFLQSFMLLAQEQGLGTCAQECWSQWPGTVADFCGMDEDLMLFCGVAIGHPDRAAPVNRLKSERSPLESWVKVL